MVKVKGSVIRMASGAWRYEAQIGREHLVSQKSWDTAKDASDALCALLNAWQAEEDKQKADREGAQRYTEAEVAAGL